MDKQTVYDIHKSLVEHNIITKQRVKECSTIKMRTDELKHNKGHSRRLLRCGYVHLCPICSAIQDKKIIQKVRPLVTLLKQHDGDVHLITLSDGECNNMTVMFISLHSPSDIIVHTLLKNFQRC